MKSTKIKALSVICSILQIIGLVIIFQRDALSDLKFMPILVGIAGFAAVVRFFLPPFKASDVENALRPIAAIAGIIMIIFACTQMV